MDSEKRNNDFGDMDSAFPRLMFFGEIRNSARRGFGGMRAKLKNQNAKLNFNIGAFVYHIILYPD